jgi:RNA recognition motif-containing protein
MAVVLRERRTYHIAVTRGGTHSFLYEASKHQSETDRMATEDARKLFVAGLPDSATEEGLRGLFSESGIALVEVTLPRDRMSGRLRGFAFVRLESEEDATRARQVLDGHLFDGRSISVRPFQFEPPTRRERGAPAERGERSPRRDFGGGSGSGGGGGNSPDRTLYVGNLPYDTTQEEVESVLGSFGVASVARVHLPVDQEGRRRGFGFVTLQTTEAATEAVERLKGADMRGRRLIVNVAQPKGSAPSSAHRGGDARPPRSYDSGPPRFGGPPGGGFGGPPPGALGSGKPQDGRRRKRYDNEGDGGGGGRSRGRRDDNDRWGDDDE